MHKCFFPLPKQKRNRNRKRNRNEMKMKTVSKAKVKGKGKYARVPGSACVIARQTNTAWLFESLLESSGSFHSSLSPSPHSSLVRLIQIFDCFSLWRQLLFVSIRSYFICLLCKIISQKAKNLLSTVSTECKVRLGELSDSSRRTSNGLFAIRE